jgi:MFS family permease
MSEKALEAPTGPKTARQSRLPFFYGWLLVGVSFVTMAIGVNARTAFSLLFPQILDEFGWDRGVTAGAFSFGFLVSAVVTPCVGWLTDRRGPRLVIEAGVFLMGTGLVLATLIREPWQLYLTLGALVGGGVNLLAYTGQSLYLTNWFVRRRGLALSIAFSGVGVGSITILPWLQILIANSGWRTACLSLGVLLVAILSPLNLLLRRAPADLGLEPDGISDNGTPLGTRSITSAPANSDDWTLGRAVRTQRFRWLAASYFCGLFTWYAVQVHQTKYLTEIGFDSTSAAWALGLVSLVAVPGQIALGHLSDRIGREWVWSIGNGGFVLACAALLALHTAPSTPLLWFMVIAQGTLGYSLTSVMGAIPAESFGSRHFGSIFGMVMLAAILGGAAGPWVAGTLHDLTGSYSLAFWLSIAASTFSAVSIWRAAPWRGGAISATEEKEIRS